jgi:hypothetical protein
MDANHDAGVVMSYRFYTIKFKNRIGFKSDSILIDFLTKIN